MDFHFLLKNSSQIVTQFSPQGAQEFIKKRI